MASAVALGVTSIECDVHLSADGEVVVCHDPTVDRTTDGRARVTWNSSAYPMAMVRDASTGALMGFVRRSGDAVVTGGRAIDVIFSDGVRSVRR